MSVKCFVLPIENNSKNNFHHCIVSNVLTLACRAVMSYFLSIQNVCIKVWRCNCTEIKMKVVVIAAIVSALGRLLLQSFYFKCKQTISDNLTACTNNKYVNESRWGGEHITLGIIFDVRPKVIRLLLHLQQFHAKYSYIDSFMQFVLLFQPHLHLTSIWHQHGQRIPFPKCETFQYYAATNCCWLA